MRSRRALLLAVLCAAGLSGCGDDGAAVGALRGPRAAPLDRPDTPGTTLQFRFDTGDVVERFDSASGSFRVHFTRAGRHAVPSTDADSDGVPDFVEEVAGVYDEVIVHYHDGLGFRPPRSDEGLPDNGGDGRFDVYLVDFAGVGDGAFRVDSCTPDDPEICAGFMTQENDYRGYSYPSTLLANRILGSHEFFHAVQAAYDVGQGSVFSEGTAVWATESFDPSLRDFEAFIDGYLDNCDRSLDVPLPGPVDPFSYGSAIFFQFLEERYGQGTVRALWERTEDGVNGDADPAWFEEITPVLAERAQSTFADAFVEFATWNLFTGAQADPARAYAAGAGYPPVAMEDVAASYSERLRVFYASSEYYRVVPAGRAAMTAALVPPLDGAGSSEGAALLLAARRGSTYGEVVRVDDPAAGAQTVDTAGADRMVVVVVNGAQEGDSFKPTLCIGTPDEVAVCRAAAGGGGSGGGGGGSGSGGGGGSGGGSGDGGSSGDGDGSAGVDDGGCGCRAGAPAPATGILAHGLLLLALVLRRRQRSRPCMRAAA